MGRGWRGEAEGQRLEGWAEAEGQRLVPDRVVIESKAD